MNASMQCMRGLLIRIRRCAVTGLPPVAEARAALVQVLVLVRVLVRRHEQDAVIHHRDAAAQARARQAWPQRIAAVLATVLATVVLVVRPTPLQNSRSVRAPIVLTRAAAQASRLAQTAAAMARLARRALIHVHRSMVPASGQQPQVSRSTHASTGR